MGCALAEKYRMIGSHLNERLRRHWAAMEALALGRGGVVAVAAATGMSRNTIYRGIAEVRQQMPQLVGQIGSQRARRPGAGRPAKAKTDPTLLRDLEALVSPTTRGDPGSGLRWTCKSTRKLAAELRRLGHQVSHMTVARLLAQLGYSLQANRKTREGSSHPDRNAQFEHIDRRVRSFQRRGQPVISVDTKKRELVGDFKNNGREWHPKGQPEQVRVHDFRDPDLGVAIPYGVYDVTCNQGWVSVGVDHDTAAFAVETIRRWWRRMGAGMHAGARELLITADGGGSNGSRSRQWKACLQALANETGLTIRVCHFPPGTSKWNRIEHRLFCHITENWRGKPLVSHAVIVELIGHVSTAKGLKVRAALDGNSYETGIKVTDAQFRAIRLAPDGFHGDWNYAIRPQ
jgi:transposase